MTTLLTLPAKELTTKLRESKAIFAEIVDLEQSLLRNRSAIEVRAWKVGELLADLKEEIGHGKWMLWLPANFRELGSTDSARIDNAARCMRFYKDNASAQLPNSWNARNFDAEKYFNIESRRKFMWGYIPAKERPALTGNRDIAPQPHYLSFINHFNKWFRQVTLGHIPLPDRDAMRRAFEPVIRRQIELLGPDWIRSLLPNEPITDNR